MATSKDTKILVVDDDPFILDMYVIKFKEQGFQIDTADFSSGSAYPTA